MNKKFISKSNYVLRKVLNKNENVDILKNFIEAILEIDIDEIELNPYLTKKAQYLPAEENFGIADVRVKTKENEQLNIGIQFLDGEYIQTKILMYYAQIHLNQLEYDRKREIAKTITINILDFKYFNFEDYQKIIKIDSNQGDIKLEELEICVLELPKFYAKRGNLTLKDQWVCYFKGSEEDKLDEILKDNPDIKKLDDLLNKYWEDEKMI